MFTFIKKMSKKVKQKVLLQCIVEFINDPQYKDALKWYGGLGEQRRWIMEFTDHTNAAEPRKITYQEVEDFTAYVFKTEWSESSREEAAKVLRKFWRFCIKHGYMSEPPTNRPEPPTETEKQRFLKSITKDRRPNQKEIPDLKVVRRIRELYHNPVPYKLKKFLKKGREKLGFREIVPIVNEEFKDTGKKYYLEKVHMLYHSAVDTDGVDLSTG